MNCLKAALRKLDIEKSSGSTLISHLALNCQLENVAVYTKVLKKFIGGNTFPASTTFVNRAAVGVRGLCFTFGFLTAQP